MNRFRIIAEALWPTLVLWIGLVAFAFLAGADWPNNHDGWVNLVMIALIVEFLLLKSWLMASRMHGIVWLTVSLVAANVAFAVVYLVFLAAILWGEWYFAHLVTIRWSTRIGLTVVLLWGCWMLANVPPPEREKERP